MPGKLELAMGEVPLLVRVYRNLTNDLTPRETVLSCKATLPHELDASLPVPVVIDRWTRRGPLGGLLTTMARMRSPWVFAAAGDAPFLDAAFVAALAAQRREGDEAVVAAHDRHGRTQLEPLGALYDRLAFVREGLPLLRAGRGKLQLVIERLRARVVPVEDPLLFANVNTPEEYRSYGGVAQTAITRARSSRDPT